MNVWPSAALDALPWSIDTRSLARWAAEGLVDSVRVPGRGRTGLEHRWPARAARRGIALTALARQPALQRNVDRWLLVETVDRCPGPGLLVVTLEGVWGGHIDGAWAGDLLGLDVPLPATAHLEATLAATVTA